MYGKYDNCTPFSADEFDRGIKKSLPYYEEFHNETINLVKAIKRKAGIWLDTGCGTGSLIEKAVIQFKSMHFILSDPSAEMLRIAENKLRGYKNVQILKPAPTIDISIHTVKPDIITTIQSHHYVDNISRKYATEKCYKLLADNGLFITFENIRPRSKKGIEIGKQYWKMFQMSQGKDEDSAEKHIQRFDVIYFPITIEEHMRLYEDTGFKVFELFWYSYMQAGFYCIK